MYKKYIESVLVNFYIVGFFSLKINICKSINLFIGTSNVRKAGFNVVIGSLNVKKCDG